MYAALLIGKSSSESKAPIGAKDTAKLDDVSVSLISPCLQHRLQRMINFLAAFCPIFLPTFCCKKSKSLLGKNQSGIYYRNALTFF